MFLDEAIIEVKGGHGGKGCVGWRREKYVPEGGPNGGDGGRGGSVFLQADENTDTLSDFASQKKFEAEKGGFGRGQLCGGKDGDDLILPVPPGTVITQFVQSDTGETVQEHVADLLHHGDRVMVAKGGRGGFGNAHFKSSTRQKPDFAELGEPGHTRKLRLDLKLVADVGIIGYPSVGKSTLISVISSAKPKIAAYPFTTLVPNLGVVTVDDRRYIVCDIPGLIEGASEGKGLGHEFLRHIERCGVLLHVLDVSRSLADEGGQEPDVQKLIDDYRAIRHELQAYSPTLAAKRELVILNKTDLIAHETAALEKGLKKAGIKLFLTVSAVTRTHIDVLMQKLLKVVLEERENRKKTEAEAERAFKQNDVPILRPHLASDKMGSYRIERKDDGTIVVSGTRLEQFTVMTNFDQEEGVRRFQDVLERIGLRRALKKMTDEKAGAVMIGGKDVTEFV